MSVFLRNDKYVVQWREAGRVRTLTVGPSKSAAKRIEAKKREAELMRRAGVVNVLDEQFAKAEGRSLTNHLADFQKGMEANRVSPRHREQVMSAIEKVCEVGGLKLLSDLREDKVQAAVAKIKEAGYTLGGEKRKYSPEALNKYIQHMKTFSRWCSRNHRTQGNMLDGLRKLNTATDRRHDRRVFTDEEITKLLNPEGLYKDRTCKCGISREDRAMLYRVAMLTGFRASELRSLTPESFNLDGFTAEVAAAFSKRRRQDVQPLPVELVEKLRPWLATREPGKRLWQVALNMAKVLRRDLKALGIPYKVAGKYGDFHALRHTYITRLVEAGLSPNDAKLLARHSTITLTMDRYSHVAREDLQTKLAKVPGLGAT